jgi:5-(carboxyamino)imidazole ribonucleotide synthase
VNGAILPGSIVGVLGGGQLGRMFALAARRMGYRVHVYADQPDAPASQVADLSVVAPYDDLHQVAQFSRGVNVLTFEFENVPAVSAAAAEAETIVRPNGRALEIAQHRVREKQFLAGRGLPVTPFAAVESERDFRSALSRIGKSRAVLKTARLGYDGKGQVPIDADADLGVAWGSLGRTDAVLEAFIDLEREISVIVARGSDGAVATYAPIDNTHRHHILDLSVAPAPIPAALADEAIRIAIAVVDALSYIGVLCVEFFVARDGRLMINEIAPRPHNSGHLTIDACRTSQFEQQVRAICGLPLGSTELLLPAAMANLLGDLWADGEPDWPAALTFPSVALHLYGKRSARPGRKMGHLTSLGPNAASDVQRARDALTGVRMGSDRGQTPI